MTLRSCFLFLPLLALILTGCGGLDAESSGTSSQAPAEPAERSVVDGQAVKGLVQGGVVTAYALENGLQRFLAESVTDADGRFSLSLPPVDSPVLVEITPAPGATMVCDASSGCGQGIAFGDPVPLPEDFRLTAILTADEAAGAQFAVTPLSHMAARWVASLPAGATDQSIQSVRTRVAALVGLDDDFLFQNLPDVSDAALSGISDQNAVQHAMIAAAFAELAGDTGRSVQQVMNDYADLLINNAGQLPQDGDSGLAALLGAARDVAASLGDSQLPAQISGLLQTLLDGLGQGMSQMPAGGEFNQADFDRALVALDDLDHYLNTAGIDDSGSFLATQAPQITWLYEPETLGLVESVLRTGVTAVVASVMAGVYEDLGFPVPNLPLSEIYGAGDAVSASYSSSTGQLVVSGTENGQTLSITIGIDPITSSASSLDYSVDGEISNAVATGQLDGTLNVNLHETDLSGVLSALRNMFMSGDGDPQQLLDALKTLLPQLHVTATVDGSGSLAKTDNAAYAFSGDLLAWGELDVPAIEGGGDLVSLQITSGSFTGPEGDTLFSYPGTPALAVQVGNDAHLQAYFGTEAFGLPEMTWQADGTLAGVGGLVSDIMNQLNTADLSQLDLSQLLSVLSLADYSVLDISGEGALTIQDPAGSKHYEFVLDGTRLDASLPNSTEQALSFYLTALNGGYIYAGETLVATVTIDWQKLGATLYLADGSTREYFLGPITDILPALPDA
jgi:hypothetical protein